MNKKRIMLSLGTIVVIAVPITTAVSCGKPEKQKIDYDFSDKVHGIKTAAKWAKDFYKHGLKAENTDFSLTLPAGAAIETELTASQVQTIQNAGEVKAVTDDMTFTDFIDTMKASTGTTHQYYYAKSDGVMLGVDSARHGLSKLFGHFGKNKSHAGKSSPITNDQKNWIVTRIIGKLPSGISMTTWNPNTITNNVKITFTNGTDTNIVDFHLGSKHSQADADKANAKGGSKFYKAIHAITGPIKKVTGEAIELAKTVHTNGIPYKQILTGMLEALIGGFIDEASSIIPIYGEIIHIPIIGNKVTSFVDDHIVNKIIEHVIPKGN